MEYNETTDKAARSVVDGDTLPDVTFEEVDPPIGGLRTWPQIRMKPTNKPDHIRKLTNLKTDIKKNLGKQRTPRPPKEYTGNSYKQQETREPTSAYKHTHNPHTDPDKTHMRWHGAPMSTDAKRNKIPKAQCSAPNATNLSPTHTS